MAKTFIRKDVNKKARLPVTWRKPKGITNKKRLNRKGHTINVRTGYGSKDSDRNKIQGFQITLVHNLAELKQLNPKTQCAILARAGKKKKMELIKEAQTLKIKIVNLNTTKYEERVKKFLEERQQKTKNKRQDKVQKESQKEEQKKADEKKQETAPVQELSEEEKKKAEKVERDKVLTKSR